jgi:hypothetical protein
VILLAGGDSMVWGSELQDSPHGGPDGYSRNTFPALLGADNYICAAYPGISNKEIRNRMREKLKTVSPDFVIVCWTWASRDNKLDSDAEIIDLQDYLKYHNIPYLFTCVDNCVATKNPYIDWYHWYLFPSGQGPSETKKPRGFYQWAIENKYSIGPEHHPLELAHRDAADLIRNKFYELVEKFNQQNQIRNSLS